MLNQKYRFQNFDLKIKEQQLNNKIYKGDFFIQKRKTTVHIINMDN